MYVPSRLHCTVTMSRHVPPYPGYVQPPSYAIMSVCHRVSISSCLSSIRSTAHPFSCSILLVPKCFCSILKCPEVFLFHLAMSRSVPVPSCYVPKCSCSILLVSRSVSVPSCLCPEVFLFHLAFVSRSVPEVFLFHLAMSRSVPVPSCVSVPSCSCPEVSHLARVPKCFCSILKCPEVFLFHLEMSRSVSVPS